MNEIAQKLREAAASVRAFLKPEYGREISAAADIIEALEGQVAEYARIAERTRAEADARIDAQTAEIARLRDALEESQSLFAAMCHEVRPLEEIQDQMIENRAALSGEIQ